MVRSGYIIIGIVGIISFLLLVKVKDILTDMF